MQTDHFPILNLNNSVAIGSKYVLHCPQFSTRWFILIPLSTFSLWLDNAHKRSWQWVWSASRLLIITLIVLSLMFASSSCNHFHLRSKTLSCVWICASTQEKGKTVSICAVPYKSKYCKIFFVVVVHNLNLWSKIW